MPAAAARIAAPALSPLQKAAVLVMYLEREAARAVLRHLGDDDVKSLGRTIAELGELDESVIDEILNEFLEQFQSVGIATSGEDFARNVLPDLLDVGRRDTIVQAVRRADTKSFEAWIKQRPPRAVAAVLADEHPQVRAVALLKMGPDTAAKVMDCFPPEVQADLAIRMTRAEKVSVELAEDVELALRAALSDIDDPVALGGIEGTAMILGRLPTERNNAVLAEVRNQSESLADDLIKKMVRFEDLERIDGRGIQALLRAIDSADLPIALRGATESLREHFLGNLSQRAAADVREELSMGANVRRTLVREAQDRIVAAARRLSDEGVLYLETGAGEAAG